MPHQVAQNLPIFLKQLDALKAPEREAQKRQQEIQDFIFKEQVKEQIKNRAAAQKLIEAQRLGREGAETIQAPSATFSTAPQGATGGQLVTPFGEPLGSPVREEPLSPPSGITERFDRSKALLKGPTSPLQEAFKGSEASEASRQAIQGRLEAGDISGGQEAIESFLKDKAKELAPSSGPPTLLRLIEQEASDDPVVSAAATEKIKRFTEIRRDIGRQSKFKVFQDRVKGDPIATQVVEDLLDFVAQTQMRREEGREADEIPPEFIGRTLDPNNNFLSVPAGTTGAEADEKGFIRASLAQMKSLGAVDQMGGTLNILKGFADDLITAETAGDAAIQGPKLTAGAVSKKNANAATYRKDVTAFLSTFSKGITAEVGTLTEGDISRISGAFPSFFDTKRIKDLKFKVLSFIIDNAKFAAKQSIMRIAIDPNYEANKQQLLSLMESSSPVSTDEFLAE